MTKLLKNSKSAFAFVMAFAIIAVSLFTGIAINADAATSKTVIYYDGGAGVEPTEKDSDGNILIKTANHLRWLAEKGGADTAGKTYKVDDSIGTIVLQTSSNVTNAGGLDALKNLDANGVIEWFKPKTDGQYWDGNKGDNKKGVKWNVWQNAGAEFQGTLDGNGVTIYGMLTGEGISGLFEKANGATIKNLSIKSSYAYGYSGGLLVGRSLNDNTLTIENCSFENSIVYSSRSAGNDAYLTSGLIFGQIRRINMNNCFVANNIAKNTNDDANLGNTLNIGALENSTYTEKDSNGNDVVKQYNSVKNSVILGVTPYRATTKTTFGWAGVNADVFSNVYTDQNTTKIMWTNSADNPNYVVTYPENSIKHIDLEKFTTKDVTTLCDKLDWNATWVATAIGPQLRKFHTEFQLNTTGKTHYYACEECGLKTVDGEVNHNWKVDGDKHYCEVCKYECKHTDQTTPTAVPGDCVTAEGTMSTCKDCGAKLYVGDPSSTPAGHDLEWVAEIPATCEKTGVKGYWHCKTCDKNFAGTGTDKDTVKWAEMNTAVADPATELATPIISHDAHDHNNGDVVLIYSNETGHWYVCYMCDGKLVTEIADELAAEGAVVSHKFKNSVCEECGYVCENHKYELTGKVITAGDCSTDTKEELKCSICGAKSVKITTASHKIVKVAEVATTDKLEGTKAHYECEVCHEIYIDAEGKTKATKAELVIPKVLPAGYENVVLGNTDNSNKSPATSDSVAPIAFAVVAVIATGYVLVRKFVKA